MLDTSADQKLIYDIDLSNLGPAPRYSVDNAKKLAGTEFSRVSYFLEIQKGNEPIHYVAVSMDAFTEDLSKLGIPTAQSGIHFQQPVKNLSVRTSVPGVATGEDLPGGYLEFWPNNYATQNGANVEGASDAVYDFGDQPSQQPLEGYGCMQVHNIRAKQTVFAINMWKSGPNADLGIGNSPGGNKDWTFTKSASQCSVKRLRIFVK